MARRFSTRPDFNTEDDDDEEIFERQSSQAIKQEPISPASPQPQSSQSSGQAQSLPRSGVEYEPDTKAKFGCKGKRASAPNIVRKMFLKPSDCSNEDFETRLIKVHHARASGMSCANVYIRRARASCEYEEASIDERKRLEKEAQDAVMAKRMENGTHFIAVAKSLGLVMKKEEQRGPTLDAAEYDNKKILASISPGGRNDASASGHWDRENPIKLARSQAMKAKIRVDSDAAAAPEKVSVGPAMKRSADSVLPEEETEQSDERPRKIVRSSWTREWGSLEFSFDVLYREIQKRRQGIRKDANDDDVEGPLADAFKTSENILKKISREPEVKIEGSIEKDRNGNEIRSEDMKEKGEAEQTGAIEKIERGTKKTEGGAEKVEGGIEKTEEEIEKTEEEIEKTEGETKKTEVEAKKKGEEMERTGGTEKDKIEECADWKEMQIKTEDNSEHDG